jgi:hypothetical protein
MGTLRVRALIPTHLSVVWDFLIRPENMHLYGRLLLFRVQAGSEVFLASMHLESDAAVHASCLPTTKPLLHCHQLPSAWQCHGFIQV